MLYERLKGVILVRGQETREKIMEAAIKVIAEETIEGLSTRKVSGIAEVNLAAIHYHHRSKDGMLIDLARYILNNYVLPRLEPLIDSSKQPVDLIRELYSEVMKIYTERSDIMVSLVYLWLHGMKNRRIREILINARADFYDRLDRAFGASMSTRRASKVSKRMLTFIAGKIMEMSVDGEIPDEREIEELSKMLS